MTNLRKSPKLNNFAVAFYVPPMFETLEWGTYIFFAGFLACSIIWLYFCLPETKGATLEDMDRIFGSRTGEEDAKMLDEARRDVGLGPEFEIDALKAEKMLVGGEDSNGRPTSHHENA